MKKSVITLSQKNKTKVAVTGATGSIGRQLVYTLSAHGYELILFGRDYHRLEHLNNKKSHSFTIVKTDYGEKLVQQLKGMHAIIHLAGNAGYHRDKTLSDFLQGNVSVTQMLFSAAAINGIRNIVFASTRSVYDPKVNKLPFNEYEDCSPTTAYGVSKLACEKIALYYNAAFDMRIKCLRIAQVVDVHPRPGFMLETMLKRAIKGQTIEVWGEGKGTREYLYIKDLTCAITKTLEHLEARGIFNIGSGKPVTNLQLAETINEAFGNSGNHIFVPEKSEDTNSYVMSTEHTASELGWTTKWSFKDMFHDLAIELKRNK